MTIRRSSLWTLVGLGLSLWVLAAHVYGEFRSVRVRGTLSPVTSGSILLSLSAADRVREPYLVVIYRIRNTGPRPLTVSATLGGRLLHQTTVASGEVRRVDIAWERSTPNRAAQIQLIGSSDDWHLEYLEMANLHGFTRGTIEFVILPAAQPFSRPAMWLHATYGVCVLLLVAGAPMPAPRWGRRLYGVLPALGMGMFSIAAISPLVSPFRIVLSPHTYVLGLLLLAAPHVLFVLRFSAVRLATIGRVAGWRVVAGTFEWVRATSPPAVKRTVRALPRLPWFEIAATGALAAFVFVVWSHVGAYAGGADQSGYLNGARILSRGEVTVPVRAVSILSRGALPIWAYSPLGFRPVTSDALAPTYPIGVPLMTAALSPLVGLDAAAHQVMAISALAGVLLTMSLASAWGLPRWGRLLAAAMLATSPLYLMMSLSLMSDVPALVWVTAAVLLAWHSRSRPVWTSLAGTALAMAVLTRPTNILAIVPMAISIGVSPRRWFWLVVGGLPGAVLLIWFNQAAYGAPLATGYSDYRGLFTVANVQASARNYVEWLPVLLTPLVALALGLPALLRRAPHSTAVLVSWIAVFVVFYSFYFHTHETWWYLRFLLPAFPPMIVGSLLVGGAIAARARWVPRVASTSTVRVLAGCLLATLVLAYNGWWVRHLGVLNTGDGEHAYVEAAQWARAHLPPDAVIVAMQVSGSFFYYTDFPILRYDYLDGEAMRKVQAAAVAAHRPLYAVLFPFEIEERLVLSQSGPGAWAQIGAVKHITFWEYREPERRLVSLVSKGRHGIDPRGTTCRNVAGQAGDANE